MTATKRFVVLSGPSCAGKGSLQAAVDRFWPGLLSARPVLCHSRRPRVTKGEIHGQHFYFLPPSLISSLESNPDFVVSRVRSDWQAIDLKQVEDLLSGGGLVFAEVFHTFGETLRTQLANRDFEFSSVFLLPLPPHSAVDDIVAAMTRKLTTRGTDDGPKLIERAKSAVEEMKIAGQYTHRILNPATEDDTDQWGEFGTRDGKDGERPINTIDDLGDDAKWLVTKFVEILEGKVSPLGDELSCLTRGNAG